MLKSEDCYVGVVMSLFVPLVKGELRQIKRQVSDWLFCVRVFDPHRVLCRVVVESKAKAEEYQVP